MDTTSFQLNILYSHVMIKIEYRIVILTKQNQTDNKMARLPYWNNTCINKCAAYCSDTVVFPIKFLLLQS